MHRPQLSALLLSYLLAPASGASSLDCSKIVADGHKFNLAALSGPHSVVTSSYESSTETHSNTTYTLDFCKPLKKSGSDEKKKRECPNGTRVCALKHTIQGDNDIITDVIAIAGALQDHGGSEFDSELTRLSTSDSNSDSKKEGLRLVLKGGKHPLDSKDSKDKREQRAIIEFLCDTEKTGKEGEWEAEDKYEDGKKRRAEDDKKDEDNKDGDKKDDDKKDGDKKDEDKGGDKDDGKEHSTSEHQLKKDGAALIWESYGPEKDDVDVLRLTWHTKYACEKRADDGDKGDDGKEPEDKNGNSSASWGFFTWLVIIVFLGTAAYLIFGSWLNYNRYGARGWDLLPHGDTIRDVPFLLKDWTRRVLNTVQGAGSRGGYSAV